MSVWAQIAVLTLFVWIFGIAWLIWSPMISQRPEYLVTLNNIRVLSPPEWIPADFVRESLQNNPELLNVQMTTLDSHLVKKLSMAFESHAWVRQVRTIEIQYPAQVTVDLEFRSPIAVVHVPEDASQGEEGGGSPVDADGILLPIEYFQQQEEFLYRFVWIMGITSKPVGTYGHEWGDQLVHEAAGLAEVLLNDMKNFSLRKIVVYKQDTEKGEEVGYYDLYTRHETRIIWGTFPMGGTLPSATRAGSLERFEITKKQVYPEQEKKLNYLRKLLEKYGSLDSVPDDQKPIDVSKIK